MNMSMNPPFIIYLSYFGFALQPLFAPASARSSGGLEPFTRWTRDPCPCRTFTSGLAMVSQATNMVVKWGMDDYTWRNGCFDQLSD